jgi:nitroreductase
MTSQRPHPSEHPRAAVRPLLRTRQIREFTDEPLGPGVVDALLEVARWSGSSRNAQPWRFVLIRERETLDALSAAGMPQTRSLRTATAAIAIALPADPDLAISMAYDDGRVAERLLVAASLLGIGAGIAWIRGDVLPTVRERLGLPETWLVRTIVALGHPSPAALEPKSAPGTARRPRAELVVEERWRD